VQLGAALPDRIPPFFFAAEFFRLQPGTFDLQSTPQTGPQRRFGVLAFGDVPRDGIQGDRNKNRATGDPPTVLTRRDGSPAMVMACCYASAASWCRLPFFHRKKI
jgi:hypothetical protein